VALKETGQHRAVVGIENLPSVDLDFKAATNLVDAPVADQEITPEGLTILGHGQQKAPADQQIAGRGHTRNAPTIERYCQFDHCSSRTLPLSGSAGSIRRSLRPRRREGRKEPRKADTRTDLCEKLGVLRVFAAHTRPRSARHIHWAERRSKAVDIRLKAES